MFSNLFKTNNTLSDTDIVKLHLQKYGKITAKEACNKYDIYQLNSIIYELRHRHKMNIVNNRNKDTYGVYILNK